MNPEALHTAAGRRTSAPPERFTFLAIPRDKVKTLIFEEESGRARASVICNEDDVPFLRERLQEVGLNLL